MKTIALMFVVLALPLTGCEQEVSYRGSSFDRQFSQMNKEGWQVAGSVQPRKPGETNDPNVRMIREADFSGMQFRTNFQIDDPRYPQTQPRAQNPESAPQTAPAPVMTPWGIGPVTPGQ
jgi:hypothetical protein